MSPRPFLVIVISFVTSLYFSKKLLAEVDEKHSRKLEGVRHYRPMQPCNGDGTVTPPPWGKYEITPLPSLVSTRIAFLIALHPPKFDEAARYLESSLQAEAASEADTYFLLWPQDLKSFQARFPGYTNSKGCYTLIVNNSGIEWIDKLMKPKGTPDMVSLSRSL